MLAESAGLGVLVSLVPSEFHAAVMGTGDPNVLYSTTRVADWSMFVLNVKTTGADRETLELPFVGVTETMVGPPLPVVKLPVVVPPNMAPAADCPITIQLMVVPPGNEVGGVLVMCVPSALQEGDTNTSDVPAKK